MRQKPAYSAIYPDKNEKIFNLIRFYLVQIPRYLFNSALEDISVLRRFISANNSCAFGPTLNSFENFIMFNQSENGRQSAITDF